jgi:CheY-like chemotaxis protein
MVQKEWEILIVDDEPDMFAVSKLALRTATVYGIPLKLHFCASKAEAVELLDTKGDFAPTLAVGIIDVVMETETAGLDLCKFIREERGNQVTQLFIRTGQPGTAPERDVVDRYDINGYFTKGDATEDKLYSMIKSGVRQYYWSVFAPGVITTMRTVTSCLGSRSAISSTLQKLLDAAFYERSGESVASYTNVNYTYIFGDEVAAGAGWSPQEALAVRDRLDQRVGVPLGTFGKYVLENRELLIKVSPGQGIGEAWVVATVTFDIPQFVPTVLGEALASHAAIWHASS